MEVNEIKHKCSMWVKIILKFCMQLSKCEPTVFRSGGKHSFGVFWTLKWTRMISIPEWLGGGCAPLPPPKAAAGLLKVWGDRWTSKTSAGHPAAARQAALRPNELIHASRGLGKPESRQPGLQGQARAPPGRKLRTKRLRGSQCCAGLTQHPR